MLSNSSTNQPTTNTISTLQTPSSSSGFTTEQQSIVGDIPVIAAVAAKRSRGSSRESSKCAKFRVPSASSSRPPQSLASSARSDRKQVDFCDVAKRWRDLKGRSNMQQEMWTQIQMWIYLMDHQSLVSTFHHQRQHHHQRHTTPTTVKGFIELDIPVIDTLDIPVIDLVEEERV
jgi:hypothetical protein